MVSSSSCVYLGSLVDNTMTIRLDIKASTPFLQWLLAHYGCGNSLKVASSMSLAKELPNPLQGICPLAINNNNMMMKGVLTVLSLQTPQTPLSFFTTTTLTHPHHPPSSTTPPLTNHPSPLTNHLTNHPYIPPWPPHLQLAFSCALIAHPETK